jgi:hypothetical protein
MNEALREVAATQSLRCSDFSITWLSAKQNDLLLRGNFSCAQIDWNSLDQEKLEKDFTAKTGLDFAIMPPAGGGGGTIHN